MVSPEVNMQRFKLTTWPAWTGRDTARETTRMVTWSEAMSAHPDAEVFWDCDMGAHDLPIEDVTIDHSESSSSGDSSGWVEISVNLGNGVFVCFVLGVLVRDGKGPRWIQIRNPGRACVDSAIHEDYLTYYGRTMRDGALQPPPDTLAMSEVS